jgi:hypothetical protein
MDEGPAVSAVSYRREKPRKAWREMSEATNFSGAGASTQ